MDTNQVTSEEIVYEFETPDNTKAFVNGSEKHKMIFNFGIKHNGFMKIDRQEEDKIIFDVYPGSLTLNREHDPKYCEKVSVDKKIVDKEITSFLTEDITPEDIEKYVFDSESEDFYIDILNNMPETHETVKEALTKKFLDNESFPFIADTMIEGVGCLYSGKKPVGLIESIWFSPLKKDSISTKVIGLFSLTDLSQAKKTLSFVFFPYRKKYGYQIFCSPTKLNADSDVQASFNQTYVLCDSAVSIVKREDYPAFSMPISKINTDNGLDLYIVDPYEQRRNLMRQLTEEYEKTQEVNDDNE